MAQEKILILEDEKLIRWSLREKLTDNGYRVEEAASGGEGLDLLEKGDVDLLLLDYRLPDTNGLTILRTCRDRWPETQVILMTAYSSVEGAVEAMKLGAYDYVNKPFKVEEMLHTVEKALETTRLRREVAVLRSSLEEQFGEATMVGDSPAIRRILGMIEKVAASRATTILLQGESGTGKDLAAKAIHSHSDRASQPFMNITCSALPETLLESELMGHERGAFTDAKAQKKGLFELADGGTVFLDEIGDMGLGLQAKLLRFLEERAFKRVGGTRDITVDVRIVAATNRDLQAEVEQGRFREDLFYRLNVVPITIPPLRDRPEDIPLLAAHFIQVFNREFRRNTQGFSEDALQQMVRYHWPGNIRELKNVVERAMILDEKRILGPEDLPEQIRSPRQKIGGPPASVPLPAEGVRLEDVEKDLLRQAMDRVAGNQSAAARLLGISRDTLRYRLKKYGYL